MKRPKWLLNTHRLYILLVLMTPVFLQQCHNVSAPSDSEFMMVNGSAPTTAHPASWSAVALVDKRRGEHFCSGTLVAPQLLVTAAHCVFDKRPGDFQVLFGGSIADPDAVRRDVVAKETFKKFQKFESNFDIAWVRFSGETPQGFRPIEIWHDPSYLQKQTPITLAGYGSTASDCAYGDKNCSGGVLLTVDTVVREFVHHARLFNLLVVGPTPKQGPCFGDSGGGAYIQQDGSWYLIGDFMGWDRILVSEDLPTICDKGEAIYNFVGDFANWLESSSGVSLAYNAARNPRLEAVELPSLTAEPTRFAEWCAYNNHEDPAWFTVQRLIRLASDYRLGKEGQEKAREVFEDCTVAESWLFKLLAAEKRLVIPGFDPANFVDSARLEDIRPLASLVGSGIEELVLSDHSIRDLSPLAQLKSLTHLEIIDNTWNEVAPRSSSKVLNLSDFPRLRELRILNTQAPVSFLGINRLAELKKLELSYVDLDAASELGALKLQELRLDSVNLKEPLVLRELTGLRTLFLAKMSVASLPRLCPDLRELELLELRDFKNLPVEAPELEKFFLYASDLQGTFQLGFWPKLRELSVISNAGLTAVNELKNLPELEKLELVENGFLELAAVQGMPKLKSIQIVSNKLSELPLFSDLPALSKLDLEGNGIRSLAALGFLPQLEYLNVSKNPLASLDGLADLPKLRRLALQSMTGGGLKSFRGLSNLPALEEINASKNAIGSINELTQFPRLKILVLSYNLLEDVSALRSLSFLQYVELVHNPLKSRDCPSFKKDACRFEWLNVSAG